MEVTFGSDFFQRARALELYGNFDNLRKKKVNNCKKKGIDKMNGHLCEKCDKQESTSEIRGWNVCEDCYIEMLNWDNPNYIRGDKMNNIADYRINLVNIEKVNKLFVRLYSSSTNVILNELKKVDTEETKNFLQDIEYLEKDNYHLILSKNLNEYSIEIKSDNWHVDGTCLLISSADFYGYIDKIKEDMKEWDKILDKEPLPY